MRPISIVVVNTFVDILRRPIGERVLPLEYVKLYFNLKPNLTWEQMYYAANQEYSLSQQKKLEKIAQKRKLEEEAKEKERLKQEEQERVLREKKEAEELQRQQEEERKRELQRQEEERLKKIQREKEEKEALEARKEVKNFLLGDLIHISDDDDSEDNAEKEEDDKKIDETKVKKEASTEDNVTPKSLEKTKTPEKKEPALIPPGSIKRIQMCSPNLCNNKKTLSQKYIQKKTLKIVMTSQRRCHLRQGL